MAYLLHPTSFSAPAALNNEGQSAAYGASLLRPVRTLLQGIQAALHGEPVHASEKSSRASAVSSSSSSSPSSSSQSSHGRGGATATLNATAHNTPSSVPPETSSHPQGTRTSARRALSPTAAFSAGPPPFAAPRGLSAAPTSAPYRVMDSSSSSADAGKAARTAVPTDAELYSRAVDYADVEEVLRCPLPVVEGCPTPYAYGGHTSKDVDATAASVQELPSSTNTSSRAAAAAPASPPLSFRCIAADPDSGITIYSTPVEECPMHLMRAYAILPCPPGDVLQYMDNDVRPQWDTYIRRSAMLRELPSPAAAAQVAQTYELSTSLGTAGAAVGHRSATSLSAMTQQMPAPATSSSPRTPSPSAYPSPLLSGGRATSRSDATPRPFAYRPGQRRVGIHYLETRSPVPFVQDRDFELVVAEEVTADGTAYSKAFSTPFGYHMPLDPQQSRYVRAVVLLSGLVARPLDAAGMELALPPVLRRHRAALLKQQQFQQQQQQKQKAKSKNLPKGNTTAPTSESAALYAPLPTAAAATQQKSSSSSSSSTPSLPTEYCVLEYIGLVHPMGMLPAVLVNIVISAQLNAMRKMQRFIAGHPMSELRPRSSATAWPFANGEGRLQATVPALTELSAALRASPSNPTAASSAGKSETTKGESRNCEEGKDGGREGGCAPSSTPASPAAEDTVSAASADQGEGTTAKSRPLSAGASTSGKANGKSASTGVRPWWRWQPSRLLSRL